MSAATRSERNRRLIAAVRARLQAARRPLLAEIRAYPGPIAGCDVHYQDLVERRQTLTRELGRLDEIAAKADPAAALKAFVETTAALDDGAKAGLLREIG